MPGPHPPPVRQPLHRAGPPPSPAEAARAVEAVKAALGYMELSLILDHPSPHGVCYDAVIIYQGFAVDRVHVNPETGEPLPKGCPCCATGEVDPTELLESLRRLWSEVRVVEAAEYREPEGVWVVPLAWRSIIIAHVKVSRDGSEIVPDYPLSEEVRRRLARL